MVCNAENSVPLTLKEVDFQGILQQASIIPLVTLDHSCNSYALIRVNTSVSRYNGGWTATGSALQRAIQIFNGSRKNGRKVIFLLTDGESNIGITPKIPANILKNKMGIDMFVLGISIYVAAKELTSIASSTDHVFRVRHYNDLNKITEHLEASK